MRKILCVCIALGMLLYAATAPAQVSIRIGAPNVSIGIHFPVYPELVVVPGYPVYYAPGLDANYFFYDGLYWVFYDDYWYVSSWYDGPWAFVEPEFVPAFILRIPVRYYRRPPVYFHAWHSDAPPRWGERWGHEWEQHRSGWDRWDRAAVPARAPLPAYQREYSQQEHAKNRYPRQVEQQQELHQQRYRYQPHDPVVRQHAQERAVLRAPGDRSQDSQRSTPPRQEVPLAPRAQPTQRDKPDDLQRGSPAVPQQNRLEGQERSRQPAPERREQQSPKLREWDEKQQGKDAGRDSRGGKGQEQERGRDRHD